jgi:hypothetical protein
MGVDEVIPVTIESKGLLQQRLVHTEPEPGRVTTLHQLAALSSTLDCWMALSIALLMSWRRADSNAVRALALALALYNVSDVGLFLPGGLTQSLMFLTGPGVRFFICISAYHFFAIACPEAQSRFAKPWVRISFAALVGLSLALSLFEAGFSLRLVPLFSAAWQYTIERVAGTVATVGAVAFLWIAWRVATGTAKNRAGRTGPQSKATHEEFALFRSAIFKKASISHCLPPES